MRALLLVQSDIMVDHSTLYAGIAGGFSSCEIRQLGKDEQKHLARYFKSIEPSQYDRIILFLGFKKIMGQWRFIRTIKQLVIVEHDACQNYLEGKYRGQFLRFYKQIGHAKVIVSGVELAEDLAAEGIDAHFAPKGFDQHCMSNLNKERSIEAGFIGSMNHEAYKARKAFLTEAARRADINIFRTNPGGDYVEGLNKIRYFVNCDIGFREYMQKVFEAMACGCVVISNSQGEKENRVLGLEDMNNIVFYKDVDDFVEKLEMLRREPLLAAAIARAGERHAHAQLTNAQAGYKIAELAVQPLMPQRPTSFFDRIIMRLSA